MKTKSTFQKLTSLALLVATLTIYAASRAGAAAVNTAPATTAQTEVSLVTEFSSGGINIGRGQTAAIIAILTPDRNARDQQPVEAEFMFYDWEGNVLASETKTLLPGHASSFEIRATGIAVPGRSELLPCIKVLLDPSDPRANRIVGTLEVFDNATGKAQFALNCRKAGEKPLEF